jgi:cobalt-zinc-cadmium efflux system protein
MIHSHAGHDHDHAGRGDDRRRLAWTLLLVSGYMVAELVGGWWTNSLALMADAGHMLSDAGALALSLFALWIAKKPANPRRTYGYYRAEILAALVNAAALIAMAVFIFVEAWQRLYEPAEVQGLAMMAIAAGGLLCIPARGPA